MATEEILFVDDEPNLLEGIRRQLRREFSLTTASGGQAALELITSKGPFAVIVSDMRMPVMDGIQLLRKVQEISPDSIRMMLTGNADVSTAVKAVNEGRIFRFLSKPCPPAALRQALEAALQQYRLIMAERELLEETLSGSVRLLTDLLGMVNPAAFGRASRVKQYVKRLTILASGRGEIKRADLWQFELAAMLSQIGYMVLPGELIRKLNDGHDLSATEKEQYRNHTKVAGDLIGNIPRLDTVAAIVANQNYCFDGYGAPPGAPSGFSIPVGARILKIALDFDTLVSAGSSQRAAVAALRERATWYDPQILDALEELIGLEAEYQVKKLSVRELKPAMILADDVFTTKDQLLISKGFELTVSIIKRLGHFAQSNHLREPICVLVPSDSAEADTVKARSHGVPQPA
jgi:response regulator RpfG family c-di-GMP phosphodiesterase